MLQPQVPYRPLWSRSFIILSLSNALLFAGFYLLLPTLPLFASAYGATPAQIGFIVGGFTFSAILMRLFTSGGVRRWGHVHFLRMGLAACILSMGGYYYTDQASATIAVRLAHGLGFGIATTLYSTLAVKFIPPNRRGEGMGYFSLWPIFMMALAPLTGLWLYETHQAHGLFLAGTLLQGLALCSLFLVRFPAGTDAIAPGPVSSPFLFRTVAFPGFLSFLLGICMGGIMSFITLLAIEKNFANPGLFFLVNTSCVFLTRTVSGRIFDRFGPAWVIAPAALSMFASMVCLFTGSSYALFMLAAALYGVGLGALFPALQTWMLQITPPDKQTSANVAFFNTLDIGVGGGSILLGWFAGGQGYTAVYLVTAIISFCFLGSYLIYLWSTRSLKECTA